jgi:hypothetical protein
VPHWILVISSWVEFLAAAVQGRRNRHLLYTIAALREQAQGARYPRAPEISAVTCSHRPIVKGVAREHRRLAVIDAELLLSFAAQRHHVPEVSCASTTRTAAGHLDA